MKEINILRDLFDEKIIKIIEVLLENPETKYSLSEISNLAKVNITTTFRIINKLAEKDFLDTVIVGKTRFYKIKRNEKALLLSKFLKKEENPLLNFVDALKKFNEIKKVILESKNKNLAKIIIVANSLPQNKLNSLINKLEKKYNFKLNYLHINEKQFEDMKKMDLYEINKKIIWERVN